MPAREAGNRIGDAGGNLLRDPRGAERDHPGGEAGLVNRGRDAVLHAPALRDLREDDRQRRHLEGRLRGRLPGRLRPADLLRKRRKTRTF